MRTRRALAIVAAIVTAFGIVAAGFTSTLRIAHDDGLVTYTSVTID